MTNLEALLENLETAKDDLYINHDEFVQLAIDHIIQLIEIIRVQKEALDLLKNNIEHSEDCFTPDSDDRYICGRNVFVREAQAKIEEIAGRTK